MLHFGTAALTAAGAATWHRLRCQLIQPYPRNVDCSAGQRTLRSDVTSSDLFHQINSTENQPFLFYLSRGVKALSTLLRIRTSDSLCIRIKIGFEMTI